MSGPEAEKPTRLGAWSIAQIIDPEAFTNWPHGSRAARVNEALRKARQIESGLSYEEELVRGLLDRIYELEDQLKQLGAGKAGLP